ncbi:polysaccharide lyase 8 family protein [Photobacterium sp. Alg240-V54]|uniref:polysaccharide lyase 8 family protein n=1 Tax=Photobacterium sp. Alg240-V54 TaxID=2305995 RepID=UPI0013D2B605|nr:polysaccharide lyase 8 family protein [Photobacterium sp. Alg240-V54]
MKHANLAVSIAVALSTLIVPTSVFAQPNATSIVNHQQSQPLVEYQALRQRWATSFLGDATIPFDDTLKQTVITTNNAADRYWSSMLTDSTRTSLWSDVVLDLQTDAGKKVLGANIRASYQRLFDMAKAYHLRDGQLQNNAELLSAIIDGMAFLNQHYYKVGAQEWGNWWHWELGTPKDIHNILVLLYDQLPPQLITAHTQATRYFTPEATHLGAGPGADVSSNPHYRLSTGGNRTDNTQVVILRGILDNNSAEIEAAIAALSPVVAEVTTSDGFYSDGSFLQHYDIAYNGTYGNVLLNGLGAQLDLVAGSPWQATDPVLKNIYPIIFKSYAPLLERGSMMEFVNGRAISRPKEQGHHVGHLVIASLLHYIDGAEPQAKAQLQNLIKTQITQDTSFDLFTSIKHVGNYQKAKVLVADTTINGEQQQQGFFNYPAMDRAVYRGDDWSFSLAMHSSRLGNFECMNNENKQGWFTGDGMGYLYNGQLDHYHNYWPAVNRYRLEGTTVDNQVMADCDGQRNQIRGGRQTQMDWVGSLRFDDIGAAGMMFSNWNNTLTANKSWFMFEDEIVMLGSDIKSTTPADITTTVMNRKLADVGNNKLFVNGKRWQPQLNHTMKLRTLTLTNSKLDDSDISYVFLKPTTVTVEQQLRTGDWSDVGVHSGQVSANFVAATIAQTAANDHYAYVLMPNADKEDVQDFIDEMPIKVRRNDNLAHIVTHKDQAITAANIWTDQGVKVTNQLSAFSKMALMVEKDDRELKLAVSDPLQTQTMLHLSLHKPVEIETDIEQRLQLDGQGNLMINVDGLVGQSYAFTLKRVAAD